MRLLYMPHTVTIYNIKTEELPETGFAPKETLYITVLRGVMLQASKVVNVRESGLEGADSVNLYIPFSVEAVDGVTGKTKSYVGPQEFWSAEDKTALWTLSIDGNGGETIFVKGEFVSDKSTVVRSHDDCYRLTKADRMDFGSADMQHFECGGV